MREIFTPVGTEYFKSIAYILCWNISLCFSDKNQYYLADQS